MRTLRAIALSSLLSLTCGCGLVGIIYRHTTEPLDVDFDRTPCAVPNPRSGQGDVKEIRYYVGVTWSSNAIGDIAKKNGMNTVYYADLETLSIILGIWSQRTVHIYGE